MSWGSIDPSVIWSPGWTMSPSSTRRRWRRDTGDSSGVEGPHGELGAGLTDRLGGDDADRLADVDLVARGHVAPVARLADAVLGVAGQHGPDPDLVHARGCELALDGPVDEGPGGDDDLAVRARDRLERRPPEQLGVERRRLDPLPAHRVDDRDRDRDS